MVRDYSSLVFFSIISLGLNVTVFVLDYLPNKHIYSLNGTQTGRGILMQALSTTFLESNMFKVLVGMSRSIDRARVPLYWVTR